MRRSWVHSLPHNTSKVKGHVRTSQWGIGRLTNNSITHTDLHKPKGHVRTLWCTDEPWANTDSQDSPRPGHGGSHHLSPYSILYAWPRGQHLNVILFQDSQVEVPKLGLSRLWSPITLCADLWLMWGLKKSYNPCQELSNSMWHATYTQGNHDNS
jgi:hypothetical protein